MKKIILFTIVFLASISSFSQQTLPVNVSAKQDYLKKSKNQKTVGKILLAGGAALSITGVLIAVNDLNHLFDPNYVHSNNNTSDVLVYSGLVIAAGSIPFFLKSSKNRKKAIHFSFKSQMILQEKYGNFVYHTIPSLQLKICL